MSNKKLRVLELRIDPAKGALVNAISLVENPAIQSNFIAFSKDEKPEPIKFELNNERMELLGAAMIPYLPMYRKSEKFGEYMSVFSEDTIRQIAQTFAENGFFNNMNVDHSKKSAESYVFQSYIVDPEKGLNAPNGLEVPPGTWIVGVKVNSPEVWENIKSGKTNGFSVEGFFNMIETELEIEIYSEQAIEAAIEFEELLNEYENTPKGCLMFYPDVNLEAWKLQAIKLAPNAKEIEDEPHITIVNGFIDNDDLIPFFKQFIPQALNEAPLQLELGSISKFIQPEEDVVKIDIYDFSGTLDMLNAIISDAFGISSPYGKYRPHMTIAYCEPDNGVTFSGEPASFWEFGINSLSKGKIVYSDANKVKTEILEIK